MYYYSCVPIIRAYRNARVTLGLVVDDGVIVGCVLFVLARAGRDCGFEMRTCLSMQGMAEGFRCFREWVRQLSRTKPAGYCGTHRESRVWELLK